jgi:hypothetical protein
LAVPSWAYSNRYIDKDSFIGGSDMVKNTYNNLNWDNYDDEDVSNKTIYIDSDDDDDDDCNEGNTSDNQFGGNVISDDLYNKLLGLVTVDSNGNEIQKKTVKKQSRRLLKNKNKTKNKNTKRQNK